MKAEKLFILYRDVEKILKVYLKFYKFKIFSCATSCTYNQKQDFN